MVCLLVLQSTKAQSFDKIVFSSVDNIEMQQHYRGKAENRFAEKIDVHISPQSEGTWQYHDDVATWTLDLQSRNALSINLGFSLFHLPNHTQLTIESLTTHKIYGPFTPADNEVHNQLWTPIIPGDEIRLKLETTIAEKDNIQLLLTHVNHGFVDFSRNGKLSPCHVDVACGANDGFPINDEFRDQINAVGVISIDGERFCSGVLLNNARRDETPYFLSAAHCNIDEENASSVVVYWNYQNSTCRDINTPENLSDGDGELNLYNTGAIFRAAFEHKLNIELDTVLGTDMLLLELDDPVNPDADVYFAGWNASDALPTKSIGIHHPEGTAKRISVNMEGAEATVYRHLGKSAKHFLEVHDWEYGATDKGSSGSPLFNEKKQVVGHLKGGDTNCDNESQYNSDWYGWFHISWNGGGEHQNQLKYWLDPDNSGLLEINGKALGQIFEASIADVSNILCAGDNSGSFVVNAMGGAPPYQYQINTLDDFQKSNIFENLEPGIYTVKITDSFGESIITESIEITEPSPLKLELFADYNKIIAKGSDGAGTFEYSINGVDFSNQTEFIVEEGNHTIWVRDRNGCVESAMITINLEPLFVELTLEKELKCYGDVDAVLKAKITGGSQPYKIRLNAGKYESLTEFTNLGPGTYFVEVKDNANNLMRSNSVQLTTPDPLEIVVVPKGNSNIEIEVMGGVSPYQYSVNGNPFQINNYFSDLKFGENLIKIMDSNACQFDSTVMVTQVSSINILKKSIFSILENPVSEILHLEIGDDVRFPLQLDIYSIDGQGIISNQVLNPEKFINIPVSTLKNDFYILVVTNDYGLEVQKFIKIK